MKNIILTIILILFSLSTRTQTTESSIDDFYCDYSVPDLSALSMLGIESDEIVRPGSVKEFAAGISKFINTDGTIKPAYAIEWSFLRTLTKHRVSNWDKRFWSKNLTGAMMQEY